jgi:transposase
MARPALGMEYLEIAEEQLRTTRDACEIRILQAFVLPLRQHLSIQETAKIVGRSPRWVSAARAQYIRNEGKIPKVKNSYRNHAYMTIDEEKEFLAPFVESACVGGITVVNDIHQALEEHLGHKVASATAYNLLHRHKWRKVAPDKRHVEADVQAQEEWKKNCRIQSPKFEKNTLKSVEKLSHYV